ncbi:hypothetical protein Tco_0128741 [Tanacetum coccineum]
MFQQHQGESLSEAWTRFKDLLQKVRHYGIGLWLQVQIFYDHVNPATRRTIGQSAGGKLRDKNIEESWALIEDLAIYDNKSWNDLRDFAKPVKAISLPHDVPNASDRRLIELENQVQRLMESHLAPKPYVQVTKSLLHVRFVVAPTTLNIAWKISSKLLLIMHPRVSTKREVHIGKLKLLEDFHVNDMEKDPTCPLLVAIGFLATAGAVIDCKKAKIAVGEGITRSIFRVEEIDLGVEYEIARDAELNPFKDVLVFRNMVQFLGTIAINLKGNIWESKELIEKKIDWNKPPKERDGAWHIKIELIDPNGEKFNKTFQSIPATRKLSEKENPREIIDLEHFHDS